MQVMAGLFIVTLVLAGVSLAVLTSMRSSQPDRNAHAATVAAQNAAAEIASVYGQNPANLTAVKNYAGTATAQVTLTDPRNTSYATALSVTKNNGALIVSAAANGRSTVTVSMPLVLHGLPKNTVATGR
jgi:type II secretory pathway pseudopilin PulG